jgi:hypothetical protein
MVDNYQLVQRLHSLLAAGALRITHIEVKLAAEDAPGLVDGQLRRPRALDDGGTQVGLEACKWPEHPDPANEEQWKAATRRFTELLSRLAALAESDFAVLERIVVKPGPKNFRRQCTVLGALWEITAHNSYHAGQIALLRRQAGAWPPERGGDTW